MTTAPADSPRKLGTSLPVPAPAARRVAVAGATGFVGRALLPALAERHAVLALGRGVTEEPEPSGAAPKPGIRWRRCDLFSLHETEKALEGVAVAYYLVHSMMPTSRLTQGDFEDLDLLLADNFGRAAASAGVKRIVYLGGLMPEARATSRSTSRAGSRSSGRSAARRAGDRGARRSRGWPGRVVAPDPGAAGRAPARDDLPALDELPDPTHRARRRGRAPRALPHLRRRRAA